MIYIPKKDKSPERKSQKPNYKIQAIKKIRIVPKKRLIGSQIDS